MHLAAEGLANRAIAQEVRLSRATVVQWRQRFLASGWQACRIGPGPATHQPTPMRTPPVQVQVFNLNHAFPPSSCCTAGF